jgi:hypothetical protein
MNGAGLMSPLADLPLIELNPPDEESRKLWQRALAVMAELDGDWSLVGGLMVQLHATRHGAPSIRPTVDIDILANSRRRPSATELIAQKLQELGFEVDQQALLVAPPTAFRFEHDGAVVDVLAPEGTGTRTPPRTIGGYRTVSISGGSQALARTERVRARLGGGQEVEVRTPSLLGAILLKARAIRSDHRDQDREDLALRLSCVDDPIGLSAQLKPTERRWLGDVAGHLRLDDADLGARLPRARLDQARASFRLLTRARPSKH